MRKDYEAILEQVAHGSRILDIGCSDGQLMELLEKEKGSEVRGLEISQAGVNACVAKGLAVIQGDADKDLGLFPDNSFDLVILSNTIQATMNPHAVLSEIHRIGQRAIVSLPNFGFWKIRLLLALKGKMPVTKDLPDTWYNTPNIHLCTIQDFADLARETNFAIKAIMPINGEVRGRSVTKTGFFTNLLAQKAVFVLERI
ncbi:MAG: methionine biosynthesis protein MetW [Hyphomonadaceae bacterium]|nr:MAG: methionine biosynthesis protein MetW [Hyphomonadaceae bacterium]KAF0186981.1 MAG: methionine biosynthesis protein MetW [Hyphomonadaceae bacterium]